MSISDSDSEKEANHKSESVLKRSLTAAVDSGETHPTTVAAPEGNEREGSGLNDVTEGSLLSAVMADMSKQCGRGGRERSGRRGLRRGAGRRQGREVAGARRRQGREVGGTRRPTLLEKV